MQYQVVISLVNLTGMVQDIINRIKEIDKLIMSRNTGKPVELAKRLGISERSLYDHIKLMRELGAPIEFSLYLDSYYYSRNGSFFIRFVDDLRNETKDNAVSKLNVAKSSKMKKMDVFNTTTANNQPVTQTIN